MPGTWNRVVSSGCQILLLSALLPPTSDLDKEHILCIHATPWIHRDQRSHGSASKGAMDQPPDPQPHQSHHPSHSVMAQGHFMLSRHLSYPTLWWRFIVKGKWKTKFFSTEMTWLLVSVTSSDMAKDFNITQNLIPSTGNIFLHICAKPETAQCLLSWIC